MKKIIAFAVIFITLLSCSASAYEPEDGLTARPDDSVYAVLRLEDASRLLGWIFSQENVQLFMPLILDGRTENEIAEISEFISALISSISIRSSAIIAGMNKADVKDMMPFIVGIFRFSPEVSGIVNKIASGQAEAMDVAKILVGDTMPAVILESMLKVDAEKDNIFRVNNDIFMKAVDDVVIFGSSLNEVRRAVKALTNPESRLFTKISRKFTEKDFAFMHMDYETAAELDDDGELDDLDARKYFDKPLDIEIAFKSFADKFLMSTALNLTTALNAKYADKLRKQSEAISPVQGGNIDIAHAGGSASPLAAMGTHLNFSMLKDDDAWKPIVKAVLRNLRVRFGISEEDAENFFTGPFSAVVNDTVTFEGFKIPAIYLSQTGKNGSAGKIFEKLTKSQHFSKVQDGILQLDSSISPISCLISDRGETLGINFAELSSFSEKPSLKPELASLLERQAIASMWLDFAGMQTWLNDDNNGVLMTIGPLLTFAGYGKYFRMFRDILTAELSVPSMSIWGESYEVLHTEFALRAIDANKGLFARMIKLYKEFKADKAGDKGAKSE